MKNKDILYSGTCPSKQASFKTPRTQNGPSTEKRRGKLEGLEGNRMLKYPVRTEEDVARV